MAKNITRIITLFFLFLFTSIAQPVEMNSIDNFFKVETEKNTKVYTFDGFDVSLINNSSKFIRERNKVTNNNYFAFYFLKEGYVPVVKVIKIGNNNINLGKIKFEGKIPPNKGILTGVIYKSIHGGKISFKKGIYKLIDTSEIKAIDENGISHLIKSNCKGIFKTTLNPGKYLIMISGEKSVISVIIKNNNTTIQNIQKGAMLID